MIYDTKGTKYLYDNIKNGDFLGTYRKPWYHIFAKVVFLITGNRLGHIAAIFDVERDEEDETVSFRVGEQLVGPGKVVNRYLIVKSEDQYIIDSKFRDKSIDLYLLSNKYKLTEGQNNLIKEYWNTKEEYKLSELSFTQNWFYRFFGDKKKVYDNNCSTAARASMLKIGIKDSKFDDPAPNPTEFAKFDYIKDITKIETWV